MRLFILLLLSFIGLNKPQAQSLQNITLGEDAKAYLITCGPGNEIWSHFGHTAIRIKDPANPGLDLAFNYGMFDSTDPDFVWKFTKRTMPYSLAVSRFRDFADMYIREGRYVYQQEILLDHETISQLYINLMKNYENEDERFYLYEFFFDNCATRPRDQIELLDFPGKGFSWATHPDAEKFTFRDLIDKGFTATPWVDFGIDIVLGSKLDRPVTNRELMFLPVYLSEIAAETEVNGRPLFGPKEYIHDVEFKQDEAPWFTPTILFWGLFILIFALTIFQNNTRWLKYLDVVWFTLFGALGIFVLFMWLGTDHQGTKANYNILWANPIHLFSIAFVFSKKLNQLLPKYLLVMAVILFALVIGFWLLPQEFHPASRAIVILLAFRYYALHRLNQRNLLFKSS